MPVARVCCVMKPVVSGVVGVFEEQLVYLVEEKVLPELVVSGILDVLSFG